MVKTHKILKIIIFLVINICCFEIFAADFVAQVDKTELPINQTLNLKLKLTDASGFDSPNFTVLKKSFNIVSTSQYSSTTIINGKSSSSKEWKLVLQPKKEGELIVPQIVIKTNSGDLATEAIEIKVTKSKPFPTTFKNGALIAESKVTNIKPYLFQPFFYKVRLYTKYAVDNVIFSPLELPNASVKLHGTYNVFSTKYRGESFSVIELNYIVKPLRAGKITIPRTKITGRYTTETDTAPVSSLFDFVFEENRPSNIITNSDRFTLETKEKEIEILPPVAKMKYWLPAESLTMEEEMSESTEFLVGKPISRKIKIIAKGIGGSQLNTLDKFIFDHENYKVYADKPVTQDHINGTNIIGTRIDHYNIIPQKEGEVILPEIKVQWWDVKEDKIKEAKLPKKILKIRANPALAFESQAIKSPDKISPKAEKANWWWFVLGIVIGLIIFTGILLFYKILIIPKKSNKNRSLAKEDDKNLPSKTNKTSKSEVNVEKKSANFSPGNIESCNSAQELNQFIKNYAKNDLNLSKNSSLKVIFTKLSNNNKKIKIERCNGLVKKLEGMLYFGQNYDLKLIKKDCQEILQLAKATKKNKNNSKKAKSELPKLNPN